MRIYKLVWRRKGLVLPRGAWETLANKVMFGESFRSAFGLLRVISENVPQVSRVENISNHSSLICRNVFEAVLVVSWSPFGAPGVHFGCAWEFGIGEKPRESLTSNTFSNRFCYAAEAFFETLLVAPLVPNLDSSMICWAELGALKCVFKVF